MADYFIAGGHLKIHKAAFAQEMLLQKGVLRRLLNYHSSGNPSIGHPCVDEADNDGMITIHFNSAEAVRLGEDPGELLSALKRKYRGKARGRITCRGWVSTLVISLDSDDGEIQYIL